MLLSNVVVIRWNARNKNRFEDLGYKYTKMKDTFLVKVEDLTQYSQAKVYVSCDYCGEIYQTTWSVYLKGKSNIDKDSCSHPLCTGKKAEEAILKRYGAPLAHVPEVRERIAKTNLKRYGSENPFGSKKIQDKIRKTNIEKYGVEVPTQNPEIMAKAMNTCLERYGESSYGAIYSREHKKELSPTWKGGVEYHRVERSTYEYRMWRKTVFDRDGYVCQCCGDKSHKGHPVTLAAHHIKNWNDNPDDRYDVDNGITLCERCHLDFHSAYGKSNNTQEQIAEFIANYNSDKKIC